MYNMNEALKKVMLIEDLCEEGYEEKFAEDIVESIVNPEEPAYVCNTAEELAAAIADMSRKDEGLKR